MLFSYHIKVIDEMIKRGYKVDENWKSPNYRGKNCNKANDAFIMMNHLSSESEIIYPEHDDRYLAECFNNLKRKGIEIK